MDNFARVDYYSYTIKSAYPFQEDTRLWGEILGQLAPSYCIPYRDEWDFKVPKRHNGYTFGFNIQEAIYVWFNGKDLHVEITGDGCTILYGSSDLLRIIQETADSATRIDFAHDLVCEVSPTNFVAGATAKATARGYQLSESGETIYIGSKKSERYCKVYRYNSPHPRSDRLRIEYTYKSADAVIASKTLNSSNEAIMAFSSAERYGWTHSVWKSLKSPHLIEIKANRKDRNTSKTLVWFKNQVLPALEKLVVSGDYTYDELLSDLKFLGTVEREMRD